MQKKLSIPYSFFISVAVILGACSPASPTVAPIETSIPTEALSLTAEPLANAPRLVVARIGDIDILDPHLATAYSSTETLNLIYETLFELDPDLNVIPGLAEDWNYSSDGKTLTLTLRRNVKFHSGDTFNSSDVKASIERILDESTAAVARSNLLTINNVTTPDEYTVVLNLSEPDATLPSALSDVNNAIASEADIQSGTVKTQPNGTGPFKFNQWNQGESVSLTANPEYWRDGPYVDEVEFRVVPDESSILAGLRAGQFDIGVLSDPAIITQIGDDLQVERVRSTTFHAILLNGDRPPLDNVKVRQAISCALDRQEVIDTALLGEGTVTGPFSEPVSSGDPYEGLPCKPPDLEKAKQLLTEAGYPDGFTLQHVIVPTGQQATALAEAQSEQAQLAKIGVNLEIEALEINIFVDRWLAVDFDAAPSVISGGPDPHHLYARYFMSTGNLNQVATYRTDELDELFLQGLRETDVQARQEIYREVSRKLLDASPWVWLFNTYEYTVLRPGITGFVAQPISVGSLWSLRQIRVPPATP